MPPIVTITTETSAVRGALSRLSSLAERVMTAELAQDAGDAVAGVIAKHTPVAKNPQEGQGGALQKSTHARVQTTADGTLIEIVQDAKSLPNLDGSGGGQFYWQWVDQGRPEIAAGAYWAAAGLPLGPYSTGKKALRTPFGLFARVGPFAGDHYVAAGLEEGIGPMTVVLRDAASRLGGLL